MQSPLLDDEEDPSKDYAVHLSSPAQLRIGGRPCAPGVCWERRSLFQLASARLRTLMQDSSCYTAQRSLLDQGEIRDPSGHEDGSEGVGDDRVPGVVWMDVPCADVCKLEATPGKS